jgi:hypothetical protein
MRRSNGASCSRSVCQSELTPSCLRRSATERARADRGIDTSHSHPRRTYFGSPARCGATVLLKLLPLLASQFVDQSIAPRSEGYLATGM